MSCRTVYLIDDDPASRRALAARLADLGLEAWPFAGAAHFVGMIDSLAPSCTLLSGDMVAPEALTLLRELAGRRPGWPVLVIAARTELAVAVLAMKLGAADFLLQPVAPARLAEALAAAGAMLDKASSADDARREVRERIAALTPRERDVGRALLEGMANKTAAHALGLSVRTVEMHRSRLLKKLGVRSLAEGAVLIAQSELLADQGGVEGSPPTMRGRSSPEGVWRSHSTRPT